MRVLLINPPRYRGKPVTREDRCEFVSPFRLDTPTTLLTLAAELRDKGHNIGLVEANALDLGWDDIAERLRRESPDCVVFPFCSRIVDEDLRVCSLVRENAPACLTVGYSWYSRHYARQIMAEHPHLDVQVTGETVLAVPEVIACAGDARGLSGVRGIAYRDGAGIRVNEGQDSRLEFSELPAPAFELLPSLKPYYLVHPRMSPCVLVYAGKGCPFGCEYCNMARTRYSSKPAENILAEMRALNTLGARYVWFYDEVFTINRDKVLAICEGIARDKLGIKWFCDTRVDLVDQELLLAMRRSGCVGVAYGVESGSQEILDGVNKGINIEQVKEAFTWTRRAHIPSQLNLIRGLPGECMESLRQTRALVRAARPQILQAARLQVQRGTELATKLGWSEAEALADWRRELENGIDVSVQLPAGIDLDAEAASVSGALYRDPAWWLTSMGVLARNRRLLAISIELYAQRILGVNLPFSKMKNVYR